MSTQIIDVLNSVRTGGTLKAKVFRGGFWLGGGSFIEQVIRFGRNMLVVRLLAPSAFGMMAIVISATAIFHTMAEIGVREAVIQNPRGAEEEYISAAWWMGFGRGLSLWVVLSLIAPFVARFYANPELTPLFRVVALSVLIDGMLSSRVHVIIKEMKFKKWALINHGGAIFGVLVTVVLSFLIRDVWALVIGYCSESAGRCVLSYILCPYVPSLRWNTAAVQDLFRFSKSLFGLSILNLIFARTDIFVLGKLRSASELGIYTMAIYLVQTPASFLMNVLGQTILPTFSQIQDNDARLNRILLQVTSTLGFVGMPALVFVFLGAPSLLTVAYGQRYSGASAPLMAAAVVAVINLANGQITSVFFAKGTPYLHRRCVVIMAATMLALIYPSVYYLGLVGGQISCLVAVAIGLISQLIRVHRLTGLSLHQYASAFFYPAAISGGVFSICLLISVSLRSPRPLYNAMIGMAGCVLAYSFSGLVLLRGRQIA